MLIHLHFQLLLVVVIFLVDIDIMLEGGAVEHTMAPQESVVLEVEELEQFIRRITQ